MKNNFEFNVITFEVYREALNRGTVSSLFHLNSKRGIIFFDDMDVFFQDRNTGNQHLMTFLTELDGMNPVDGIIFIFTSNKIGEELDKAFVRPGRVDLFMKFDSPNKQLRTQFIKERFHADILAHIDVDEVIERTGEQITDENEESGYTFAELEEIRKLFVIEIVSGRVPNIAQTFKLFEHHRKEFSERTNKFGFGQMHEGKSDGDQNDFYEIYEDIFDSPFK